MRAAALAGVAIVAAALPALAEITGATYTDPTDRYPHAVLGDDIEFGGLRIATRDKTFSIQLPPDLVFEDTAPRVIDVTGDGAPEVVVVESHQDQGARLAIYDTTGRIAATPFIGTRFRWLAPLGAADLDDDGWIELAYVDRPHLARTLRIWRFKDGALSEVTSLPGVTNHRIGEEDIAGGIRTCTGTPEMILADARWQRLLAVTLSDGTLSAKDIGPHKGRPSFAAAMGCRLR